MSDGEAKRITIDNRLNTGDIVTLLREQGGQKFMVIDRIPESPDITGNLLSYMEFSAEHQAAYRDLMVDFLTAGKNGDKEGEELGCVR